MDAKALFSAGYRQGAETAVRVLDVGPASTRGYSEHMRVTPEEMPPADQAPMSREERIEWLFGYAAGIMAAAS